VAEIVASQLSGRLIFEPFHPELVSDYRDFHYFQYMRPEEDDPRLLEFSRRVLSGRIRHPWTDRYVETLRPRLRVVKEIRANLLLYWLRLRFPEVPLLFVLRHPCAVVASRLSLGWATDGDLEPLLAQRALMDDFLADHAPAIAAARSPEEKHALIWCITNLIPLRQFPRGELEVLFYEDLCTEPDRVIPRIFETLGYPLTGPGAATKRASMTVGRRGGSPSKSLEGWRDVLTSAQIEAVLETVRGFGLDDLYGEGPQPLPSARERLGSVE
jgi:hypothetical protein